MQTISRESLILRIGSQEELTLIDVLPDEEYRRFHLPEAINVPWGADFDERIQQAVPDKQRAAIVYCLDSQCTASAQAAQRMHELGYLHVYDYTAGKMDWREAGLPTE